MKPFFTALLFFIVSVTDVAFGQQYINKVKFFSDTSVVNATITLNIGRLMSKKNKEGYIFPATFTCKLNDTMKVNDKISVEVRGHFRRANCYIPPLKLIYKNNADAAFYKFKTLKLVSTCRISNDYDQYILKEFTCYEIYNLITDKSFRARLLNLSYQDSAGKKKTVTQHAFLLEDIKDLAKRTDCTEWDKKFNTEATNRRQMTLVAIFEYLIGNTDWAVPVDHNVKLLRTKKDSLTRPYVVPYDFDYCGLVNAPYAVPDEVLGTQTVRERVYRGFPRSMEELNEALDIFKKQKANIYATVTNFNLLNSRTKKEMTDYLDEFYTTINNPSEVKRIFIDEARKQ